MALLVAEGRRETPPHLVGATHFTVMQARFNIENQETGRWPAHRDQRRTVAVVALGPLRPHWR